MTANATHAGRITIPGTDVGVRGTLIAEPQTEDMLLSLDDRLALGPVKVDTDPAGNLYSPGLVVPIVSGVLWLLRFEPFDPTRAAPFTLGIYNLNTSGVPLDDLIATTVTAVDATLSPTDVAVAGAVGSGPATVAALDARYSHKTAGTYSLADFADLPTALSTIPAGSTLLVPAGTYAINQITTLTKDVIIQGAGARSTILDAGSNVSGFTLQSVTVPAVPANVTFKDIGFTGSTSACIRLASSIQKRARFIDCRFSGFAVSGIELSGTALSVIRCDFDGDGTIATLKHGINHQQGGADRIHVQACRFRYLYRGVYISDTAGYARDVTVTESVFDGGWCYLKATGSGSGGAVSYTATVLTDTGASFGTLVVNSTVRAMAVKTASTMTAISRAQLTDTSADFTTAGVKRGDIVRTATAWGVVDEVTSATVLKVEQWLNLSDYDYAPAPNVGDSYTIYGLVIGRVVSNTATTITVDMWRDWDGTIATPAAGTRYELAPMSNYGGYFSQRADRVTITNNVFKRSWADQIAPQQSRHVIITGNQVYDGQDVGITMSGLAGAPGQEWVVTGNKISHQGTGGIVCGVPDAVINSNSIVDVNWMSGPTASYCPLVFQGGSNGSSATGNLLKRVNHPNSLKAVHVFQTTDTIYLDNTTRGFATDLMITGPLATNVHGKFRPNTVVALVTSAVGPRGEFSGSGVPTIPASAGSTYRRTDGAADTTLYVKETASSSTTWTPGAVSGAGAGIGTVTTSTPGTVAGNNSTADITMWTAGTISALAVGQLYRLRVHGTMDFIATPGAFNVRIKVGSATSMTVAMLTPTTTLAATNVTWMLDMDLIVEATGASGALSIVGQGITVAGNTNAPGPKALQDVGTTRDLSGGLAISVSGQTATANAGNIIRVLRASLTKLPAP